MWEKEREIIERKGDNQIADRERKIRDRDKEKGKQREIKGKRETER